MIVSFTDYIPTPRFDGQPWTEIRIQEAASTDGPWTQIDSIVLTPLDTDPKNPTARSFSTQNGTITNGWYKVQFADAYNNVLDTDPIQNIRAARQNYLPILSQVASKNMSRTRDTYGNLVGDFSSTTTPTSEQVSRIIDDVVTEVADVIGDTVPDAYIDDAQNVVALRTAMQIELSFFSDQVNTGRSIYPQLEKQYQSALGSLSMSLENATEDGSKTPSLDAAYGDPAYSFPPDTTWMDKAW